MSKSNQNLDYLCKDHLFPYNIYMYIFIYLKFLNEIPLVRQYLRLELNKIGPK